jgi:mannitol/fructose-specific phosphotransferase system IIA component
LGGLENEVEKLGLDFDEDKRVLVVEVVAANEREEHATPIYDLTRSLSN